LTDLIGVLDIDASLIGLNRNHYVLITNSDVTAVHRLFRNIFRQVVKEAQDEKDEFGFQTKLNRLLSERIFRFMPDLDEFYFGGRYAGDLKKEYHAESWPVFAYLLGFDVTEYRRDNNTDEWSEYNYSEQLRLNRDLNDFMRQAPQLLKVNTISGPAYATAVMPVIMAGVVGVNLHNPWVLVIFGVVLAGLIVRLFVRSNKQINIKVKGKKLVVEEGSRVVRIGRKHLIILPNVISKMEELDNFVRRDDTGVEISAFGLTERIDTHITMLRELILPRFDRVFIIPPASPIYKDEIRLARLLYLLATSNTLKLTIEDGQIVLISDEGMQDEHGDKQILFLGRSGFESIGAFLVKLTRNCNFDSPEALRSWLIEQGRDIELDTDWDIIAEFRSALPLRRTYYHRVRLEAARLGLQPDFVTHHHPITGDNLISLIMAGTKWGRKACYQDTLMYSGRFGNDGDLPSFRKLNICWFEIRALGTPRDYLVSDYSGKGATSRFYLIDGEVVNPSKLVITPAQKSTVRSAKVVGAISGLVLALIPALANAAVEKAVSAGINLHFGITELILSVGVVALVAAIYKLTKRGDKQTREKRYGYSASVIKGSGLISWFSDVLNRLKLATVISLMLVILNAVPVFAKHTQPNLTLRVAGNTITLTLNQKEIDELTKIEAIAQPEKREEAATSFIEDYFKAHPETHGQLTSGATLVPDDFNWQEYWQTDPAMKAKKQALAEQLEYYLALWQADRVGLEHPGVYVDVENTLRAVLTRDSLQIEPGACQDLAKAIVDRAEGEVREKGAREILYRIGAQNQRQRLADSSGVDSSRVNLVDSAVVSNLLAPGPDETNAANLPEVVAAEHRQPVRGFSEEEIAVYALVNTYLTDETELTRIAQELGIDLPKDISSRIKGEDIDRDLSRALPIFEKFSQEVLGLVDDIAKIFVQQAYEKVKQGLADAKENPDRNEYLRRILIEILNPEFIKKFYEQNPGISLAADYEQRLLAAQYLMLLRNYISEITQERIREVLAEPLSIEGRLGYASLLRDYGKEVSQEIVAAFYQEIDKGIDSTVTTEEREKVHLNAIAERQLAILLLKNIDGKTPTPAQVEAYLQRDDFVLNVYAYNKLREKGKEVDLSKISEEIVTEDLGTKKLELNVLHWYQRLYPNEKEINSEDFDAVELIIIIGAIPTKDNIRQTKEAKDFAQRRLALRIIAEYAEEPTKDNITTEVKDGNLANKLAAIRLLKYLGLKPNREAVSTELKRDDFSNRRIAAELLKLDNQAVNEENILALIFSGDFETESAAYQLLLLKGEEITLENLKNEIEKELFYLAKQQEPDAEPVKNKATLSLRFAVAQLLKIKGETVSDEAIVKMLESGNFITELQTVNLLTALGEEVSQGAVEREMTSPDLDAKLNALTWLEYLNREVNKKTLEAMVETFKQSKKIVELRESLSRLEKDNIPLNPEVAQYILIEGKVSPIFIASDYLNMRQQAKDAVLSPEVKTAILKIGARIIAEKQLNAFASYQSEEELGEIAVNLPIQISPAEFKTLIEVRNLAQRKQYLEEFLRSRSSKLGAVNDDVIKKLSGQVFYATLREEMHQLGVIDAIFEEIANIFRDDRGFGLSDATSMVLSYALILEATPNIRATSKLERLEEIKNKAFEKAANLSDLRTIVENYRNLIEPQDVNKIVYLKPESKRYSSIQDYIRESANKNIISPIEFTLNFTTRDGINISEKLEIPAAMLRELLSQLDVTKLSTYVRQALEAKFPAIMAQMEESVKSELINRTIADFSSRIVEEEFRLSGIESQVVCELNRNLEPILVRLFSERHLSGSTERLLMNLLILQAKGKIHTNLPEGVEVREQILETIASDGIQIIKDIPEDYFQYANEKDKEYLTKLRQRTTYQLYRETLPKQVEKLYSVQLPYSISKDEINIWLDINDNNRLEEAVADFIRGKVKLASPLIEDEAVEMLKKRAYAAVQRYREISAKIAKGEQVAHTDSEVGKSKKTDRTLEVQAGARVSENAGQGKTETTPVINGRLSLDFNDGYRVSLSKQESRLGSQAVSVVWNSKTLSLNARALRRDISESYSSDARLNIGWWGTYVAGGISGNRSITNPNLPLIKANDFKRSYNVTLGRQGQDVGLSLNATMPAEGKVRTNANMTLYNSTFGRWNISLFDVTDKELFRYVVDADKDIPLGTPSIPYFNLNGRVSDEFRGLGTRMRLEINKKLILNFDASYGKNKYSYTSETDEYVKANGYGQVNMGREERISFGANDITNKHGATAFVSEAGRVAGLGLGTGTVYVSFKSYDELVAYWYWQLALKNNCTFRIYGNGNDSRGATASFRNFLGTGATVKFGVDDNLRDNLSPEYSVGVYNKSERLGIKGNILAGGRGVSVEAILPHGFNAYYMQGPMYTDYYYQKQGLTDRKFMILKGFSPADVLDWFRKNREEPRATSTQSPSNISSGTNVGKVQEAASDSEADMLWNNPDTRAYFEKVAEVRGKKLSASYDSRAPPEFVDLVASTLAELKTNPNLLREFPQVASITSQQLDPILQIAYDPYFRNFFNADSNDIDDGGDFPRNPTTGGYTEEVWTFLILLDGIYVNHRVADPAKDYLDKLHKIGDLRAMDQSDSRHPIATLWQMPTVNNRIDISWYRLYANPRYLHLDLDGSGKVNVFEMVSYLYMLYDNREFKKTDNDVLYTFQDLADQYEILNARTQDGRNLLEALWEFRFSYHNNKVHRQYLIDIARWVKRATRIENDVLNIDSSTGKYKIAIKHTRVEEVIEDLRRQEKIKNTSNNFNLIRDLYNLNAVTYAGETRPNEILRQIIGFMATPYNFNVDSFKFTPIDDFDSYLTSLNRDLSRLKDLKALGIPLIEALRAYFAPVINTSDIGNNFIGDATPTSINGSDAKPLTRSGLNRTLLTQFLHLYYFDFTLSRLVELEDWQAYKQNLVARLNEVAHRRDSEPDFITNLRTNFPELSADISDNFFGDYAPSRYTTPEGDEITRSAFTRIIAAAEVKIYIYNPDTKLVEEIDPKTIPEDILRLTREHARELFNLPNLRELIDALKAFYQGSGIEQFITYDLYNDTRGTGIYYPVTQPGAPQRQVTASGLTRLIISSLARPFQLDVDKRELVEITDWEKYKANLIESLKLAAQIKNLPGITDALINYYTNFAPGEISPEAFLNTNPTSIPDPTRAGVYLTSSAISRLLISSLATPYTYDQSLKKVVRVTDLETYKAELVEGLNKVAEKRRQNETKFLEDLRFDFFEVDDEITQFFDDPISIDSRLNPEGGTILTRSQFTRIVAGTKRVLYSLNIDTKPLPTLTEIVRIISEQRLDEDRGRLSELMQLPGIIDAIVRYYKDSGIEGYITHDLYNDNRPTNVLDSKGRPLTVSSLTRLVLSQFLHPYYFDFTLSRLVELEDWQAYKQNLVARLNEVAHRRDSEPDFITNLRTNFPELSADISDNFFGDYAPSRYTTPEGDEITRSAFTRIIAAAEVKIYIYNPDTKLVEEIDPKTIPEDILRLTREHARELFNLPNLRELIDALKAFYQGSGIEQFITYDLYNDTRGTGIYYPVTQPGAPQRQVTASGLTRLIISSLARPFQLDVDKRELVEITDWEKYKANLIESLKLAAQIKNLPGITDALINYYTNFAPGEISPEAFLNTNPTSIPDPTRAGVYLTSSAISRLLISSLATPYTYDQSLKKVVRVTDLETYKAELVEGLNKVAEKRRQNETKFLEDLRFDFFEVDDEITQFFDDPISIDSRLNPEGGTILTRSQFTRIVAGTKRILYTLDVDSRSMIRITRQVPEAELDENRDKLRQLIVLLSGQTELLRRYFARSGLEDYITNDFTDHTPTNILDEKGNSLGKATVMRLILSTFLKPSYFDAVTATLQPADWNDFLTGLIPGLETIINERDNNPNFIEELKVFYQGVVPSEDIVDWPREFFGNTSPSSFTSPEGDMLSRSAFTRSLASTELKIYLYNPDTKLIEEIPLDEVSREEMLLTRQHTRELFNLPNLNQAIDALKIIYQGSGIEQFITYDLYNDSRLTGIFYPPARPGAPQREVDASGLTRLIISSTLAKPLRLDVGEKKLVAITDWENYKANLIPTLELTAQLMHLPGISQAIIAYYTIFAPGEISTNSFNDTTPTSIRDLRNNFITASSLKRFLISGLAKPYFYDQSTGKIASVDNLNKYKAELVSGMLSVAQKRQENETKFLEDLRFDFFEVADKITDDFFRDNSPSGFTTPDGQPLTRSQFTQIVAGTVRIIYEIDIDALALKYLGKSNDFPEEVLKENRRRIQELMNLPGLIEALRRYYAGSGIEQFITDDLYNDNRPTSIKYPADPEHPELVSYVNASALTRFIISTLIKPAYLDEDLMKLVEITGWQGYISDLVSGMNEVSNEREANPNFIDELKENFPAVAPYLSDRFFGDNTLIPVLDLEGKQITRSALTRTAASTELTPLTIDLDRLSALKFDKKISKEQRKLDREHLGELLSSDEFIALLKNWVPTAISNFITNNPNDNRDTPIMNLKGDRPLKAYRLTKLVISSYFLHPVYYDLNTGREVGEIVSWEVYRQGLVENMKVVNEVKKDERLVRTLSTLGQFDGAGFFGDAKNSPLLRFFISDLFANTTVGWNEIVTPRGEWKLVTRLTSSEALLNELREIATLFEYIENDSQLRNLLNNNFSLSTNKGSRTDNIQKWFNFTSLIGVGPGTYFTTPENLITVLRKATPEDLQLLQNLLDRPLNIAADEEAFRLLMLNIEGVLAPQTIGDRVVINIYKGTFDRTIGFRDNLAIPSEGYVKINGTDIVIQRYIVDKVEDGKIYLTLSHLVGAREEKIGADLRVVGGREVFSEKRVLDLEGKLLETTIESEYGTFVTYFKYDKTFNYNVPKEIGLDLSFQFYFIPSSAETYWVDGLTGQKYLISQARVQGDKDIRINMGDFAKSQVDMSVDIFAGEGNLLRREKRTLELLSGNTKTSVDLDTGAIVENTKFFDVFALESAYREPNGYERITKLDTQTIAAGRVEIPLLTAQGLLSGAIEDLTGIYNITLNPQQMGALVSLTDTKTGAVITNTRFFADIALESVYKEITGYTLTAKLVVDNTGRPVIEIVGEESALKAQLTDNIGIVKSTAWLATRHLGATIKEIDERINSISQVQGNEFYGPIALHSKYTVGNYSATIDILMNNGIPVIEEGLLSAERKDQVVPLLNIWIDPHHRGATAKTVEPNTGVEAIYSMFYGPKALKAEETIGLMKTLSVTSQLEDGVPQIFDGIFKEKIEVFLADVKAADKELERDVFGRPMMMQEKGIEDKAQYSYSEYFGPYASRTEYSFGGLKFTEIWQFDKDGLPVKADINGVLTIVSEHTADSRAISWIIYRDVYRGDEIKRVTDFRSTETKYDYSNLTINSQARDKVTEEKEIIIESEAKFNASRTLWEKQSRVWFDKTKGLLLRAELDLINPYGRMLERLYGEDGKTWDRQTVFNYDGGLIIGSTSKLLDESTGRYDTLDETAVDEWKDGKIEHRVKSTRLEREYVDILDCEGRWLERTEKVAKFSLHTVNKYDDGTERVNSATLTYNGVARRIFRFGKANAQTKLLPVFVYSGWDRNALLRTEYYKVGYSRYPERFQYAIINKEDVQDWRKHTDYRLEVGEEDKPKESGWYKGTNIPVFSRLIDKDGQVIEQYESRISDTLTDEGWPVVITETYRPKPKVEIVTPVSPLPYILGVNWSPAGIGDNKGSNFSEYYMKDLELIFNLGANTVRTYEPIWDKQVLDAISAFGLKVIITFRPQDLRNGAYEQYINEFKNHPAILMWSFGNEENYQDEFKNNLDSWYTLLETSAARAKQLDSNHLITTAHGEVRDFIADSILAKVPSVDIWGVNVYRYDDPQELFWQWNTINSKAEQGLRRPMYISEFGADSYDRKINQERQDYQERAIGKIVHHTIDWQEYRQINSGLIVFELNDEWWKNGDALEHNPGTSHINPNDDIPYDGTADEEYFGLVDINRRHKPAYYELQKLFRGFATSEVTSLPEKWLDETTYFIKGTDVTYSRDYQPSRDEFDSMDIKELRSEVIYLTVDPTKREGITLEFAEGRQTPNVLKAHQAQFGFYHPYADAWDRFSADPTPGMKSMPAVRIVTIDYRAANPKKGINLAYYYYSIYNAKGELLEKSEAEKFKEAAQRGNAYVKHPEVTIISRFEFDKDGNKQMWLTIVKRVDESKLKQGEFISPETIRNPFKSDTTSKQQDTSKPSSSLMDGVNPVRDLKSATEYSDTGVKTPSSSLAAFSNGVKEIFATIRDELFPVVYAQTLQPSADTVGQQIDTVYTNELTQRDIQNIVLPDVAGQWKAYRAVPVEFICKEKIIQFLKNYGFEGFEMLADRLEEQVLPVRIEPLTGELVPLKTWITVFDLKGRDLLQINEAQEKIRFIIRDNDGEEIGSADFRLEKGCQIGEMLSIAVLLKEVETEEQTLKHLLVKDITKKDLYFIEVRNKFQLGTIEEKYTGEFVGFGKDLATFDLGTLGDLMRRIHKTKALKDDPASRETLILDIDSGFWRQTHEMSEYNHFKNFRGDSKMYQSSYLRLLEVPSITRTYLTNPEGDHLALEPFSVSNLYELTIGAGNLRSAFVVFYQITDEAGNNINFDALEVKDAIGRPTEKWFGQFDETDHAYKMKEGDLKFYMFYNGNYGKYDVADYSMATIVNGLDQEQIYTFSEMIGFVDGGDIAYRVKKGEGYISGVVLNSSEFNHSKIIEALKAIDKKLTFNYVIMSWQEIKDSKGFLQVILSGYPEIDDNTHFYKGTPAWITFLSYPKDLFSFFSIGSYTYRYEEKKDINESLYSDWVAQ
ncbi:MAG: glycoside hydrolase family 2 TIM barrel-domain containing protein, partial [Candidatus Omnitrophota bacterium]